MLIPTEDTRVYPKVSRLAAWNENCKWYSYLPLGAVVSLSCCFSTSVYCCRRIFSYRLSPETFGYTLVYRERFPNASFSPHWPPCSLSTDINALLQRNFTLESENTTPCMSLNMHHIENCFE